MQYLKLVFLGVLIKCATFALVDLGDFELNSIQVSRTTSLEGLKFVLGFGLSDDVSSIQALILAVNFFERYAAQQLHLSMTLPDDYNK